MLGGEKSLVTKNNKKSMLIEASKFMSEEDIWKIGVL